MRTEEREEWENPVCAEYIFNLSHKDCGPRGVRNNGAIIYQSFEYESDRQFCDTGGAGYADVLAQGAKDFFLLSVGGGFAAIALSGVLFSRIFAVAGIGTFRDFQRQDRIYFRGFDTSDGRGAV